MPALTRRRDWLAPMLVLSAIAMGLLAALFSIDHYLDDAGFPNPLVNYLSFDDGVVSESIGQVATTIAAILGIIVTVVSIIVQLTATRYTPAVTEMFFRDRANQLAMSLYLIGGVKAIWIAFAVGDDWVPRVSLIAMLAIGTVGFVLMAPYFAYVFRFLAPENLVARIEEEARREPVAASLTRNQSAVLAHQRRFLHRTEQLTDIAIHAVTNKDKIIATHCVDALRDLTFSYFEHRPPSGSDWYRVSEAVAVNPDFSSMADSSLTRLERGEAWLEFKILRQYQSIYTEALAGMRDINYIVAINTCAIARRALQARLPEPLSLSIKFFNTYLRATLNRSDVRTAYTILNQYRIMGEAALEFGDGETALKIAAHIKYYGHLSYAKKLAFITETVAYDLGAMCETAHAIRSAAESELVDLFLEVDPSVTEGEIQEASLRGVRKAQIKLATYYLKQGEIEMARRIWHDMADERAERLRSIRDELAAVENEEFWEISDRGGNFDYLDPDRKAMLPTFFGWFSELGGELGSLAVPTSSGPGGGAGAGDADPNLT